MKLRILAVLAAAVLLAPVAFAQDYPHKLIKGVIPAAPGGVTDPFVRLVGDLIHQEWGQPVVMDHRGGAGGIIGAELVAKAAPDGYTLLMGNIGPLALNQFLYRNLPYDPKKDFAPIALITTFDNILVVNPSVPARDVKELIELARAQPGNLTFASAGVGQSHHLSGELFKSQTGVDIVHVPYKGGAPAVTDLLAGHVSMMFSNIPLVAQHIKSGALRAIAVTGPTRNSMFPDVPTVMESGFPNYNVTSWLALVGPAGLPQAIVQRLNAMAMKALASDEAKKHLAVIGAKAGTGDPAYLAKFMDDERAKWAKAITDAKIQLEP